MNITPPYKIRNRASNRGLSLVEILVVITIIVVIAALSTMGFARARSTARGATCTSNLRQIATAMLSYASENNGQLPPLEDRTSANDGLKGIWTQIIADDSRLPMTNTKSGLLGTNAGVWACPDCITNSRFHAGYGAAEGTVLKVKRSSKPDEKGSLRLSEITQPERTWLVGDAANSAKDLKTSWYAIWPKPTSWDSAHVPAARHGGKVNVCMVDGHVETLSVKELSAPDKNYTLSK